MKIPFPFATLVFCLAGCVTEGGKTETADPVGTPVLSVEYRLENGKIILLPRQDTRYECLENGTLSAEVRTTPAESLDYEQRGDTLYVGDYDETFGSGAKVEGLDLFLRSASGSGIGGQWTLQDGKRIYRLVSGEPTPQEQAHIDDMARSQVSDRRIGTRTYRFRDDTLTLFFDFRSAEDFLADWNGKKYLDASEKPDSATYAISVAIMDKNTVELVGMKTGEKVRIHSTDLAIRTYSSDVSGHAAYTHDQSPKTCPTNPATPDWYDAFLKANAKP